VLHHNRDCEIQLKDSFQPSAAPIYPLSQKHQDLLREWLDEQLAKGYIRDTKSPMTCPVFFVPKPGNKWRLVTDYGPLNKHMIRDAYPLPLINELMDTLARARYFTKMDLCWGYYNIRMKEGEEWKTAISTRYGSYEWTVMPMGLCNAPAIFQRMMNTIFRQLITKRQALVYMDDGLTFAKTKEELEEFTTEFLQLCAENDLFINMQKCDFNKTEIEFLGFIIKEGKIQIHPRRSVPVLDWPIPTKSGRNTELFRKLLDIVESLLKTSVKSANLYIV